MSEEEEVHCRLCAEPTPKANLITPEDDVAVTSMVLTKMQWINIDVSTSTELPSGICYSCFDQLERTYLFLNTVRVAQLKLQEIYLKKGDNNIKFDTPDEVGKPVDEDWEEFNEPKPDIKGENDVYEVQLSNNELLVEIIPEIKAERGSYDTGLNLEGFNTSEDEDLPLLNVAKKRKSKKKVKFANKKALPVLPCNNSSWDSYTWRCGNCDALFPNMQSLGLHSIQIHTVCTVFKCNDCSKTFSNFKVFVKHVREHKKPLRHCCEYCNKIFKGSSCLKKHYASHSEDLHLTCKNCGTLFECTEELEDHMLIFTKDFKRKPIKEENGEIKCDVCDKKFKSRSNLQQHRYVHTERTRDFSCHICGKMFYTKGTLSTHIMTHEDMKPYKCEHCSMSFRARGNLQSHISLHTGARPYVCEQCGKSFRVKRLLKSHYIIHTDLMPFMCEYCNKSFRFKTRLNLHLRQHTGDKPYNCVYCQRDFTNGSNYKKHMKRRHNIDTSKKKFNIVTGENNRNLEPSEILPD